MTSPAARTLCGSPAAPALGTSEPSALLACPFCGSPTEWNVIVVRVGYARCPVLDCPGHGGTAALYFEEAVAAWNRRAPLAGDPAAAFDAAHDALAGQAVELRAEAAAEPTPTCAICNEVGGPLEVCMVCGQRKGPLGRSAPLGAHYCGWDCPGYRQEPRPSELWPGERYGDSLGHMAWHEEAQANIHDAPRAEVYPQGGEPGGPRP